MTPEPDAPVKQEPEPPASGRDTALAVAEFVFAMLLLWASCVPPLYGYYAAACSPAEGAMFMSLVTALLLPFSWPPALMLAGVLAIVVSVLLRPFRGGRFWRLLSWWVLASLCACLAGRGFALLSEVTERCTLFGH